MVGSKAFPIAGFLGLMIIDKDPLSPQLSFLYRSAHGQGSRDVNESFPVRVHSASDLKLFKEKAESDPKPYMGWV